MIREEAVAEELLATLAAWSRLSSRQMAGHLADIASRTLAREDRTQSWLKGQRKPGGPAVAAQGLQPSPTGGSQPPASTMPAGAEGADSSHYSSLRRHLLPASSGEAMARGSGSDDRRQTYQPRPAEAQQLQEAGPDRMAGRELHEEHSQMSLLMGASKSNAPGLIPTTEAAYIGNAGLVLLWPFLPRFFAALDFVRGQDFLNSEARERGVLMLQYLVTGEVEAGEADLVLNKVLCGWPVADPVGRALRLGDRERQESDALLEAIIAHWSALGRTSVPGLRQAFLQREGRLECQESGSYKLLVGRAGRDVLLDRLPWGIGLVALPWMSLPLLVEW